MQRQWIWLLALGRNGMWRMREMWKKEQLEKDARKKKEKKKIKIKKRTRKLWSRWGGREKEGSNIRERKEEKEKKKEEWGEARRDNMCGRGGERQHPGGVRAGESASQLSRLVKHAAQVSLWRNNYWFIIILIGTGLRGQRRGLIISPL